MTLGLSLGLVGLAAWGLRWLIQGEGVIYTDVARAFWVPNATLGWVETQDRWVWLGLEGLGAVVGVVVGALVMGLVARRAQRPIIKKIATILSRVGAVVAMLAPVLPAWAFVSGMPPEGAKRLRPLEVVSTATPASEPEDVTPLPVPSGTWKIAPGDANLLVARVKAGGESFDAKFGPLSGEVTLDAAQLPRSRGSFAVPSTSVDTGVGLRNKHAQEYLAAAEHGTIRVTITRIDAVQAGQGPDSRALAATATLNFMGQDLEVPISGTLAVLSSAARAELGVASPNAILLNATFMLDVKKTRLDPANFDIDRIPLSARIVLVPAAGAP